MADSSGEDDLNIKKGGPEGPPWVQDPAVVR